MLASTRRLMLDAAAIMTASDSTSLAPVSRVRKLGELALAVMMAGAAAAVMVVVALMVFVRSARSS